MTMVLDLAFVTALLAMGLVAAYMLVRAWPAVDWPTRIRAFLFVLVLALAANEVACTTIAIRVYGGLATAGKFEAGQYYVGNHGRYEPVSAETFARLLFYERASSYSAKVAFAALLLLLLAAGFFRAHGKGWTYTRLLTLSFRKASHNRDRPPKTGT